MTTLDAFFSRLTLRRAWLLAALLWAGIYLPALGSLEIKGEEGRRILPAVAMLDTGDWLVPQIGGGPYFSKPPLINWVIAKSFQWTGTRGEWAARLPSVFAVLALALTTVWSLARWLGPGGGLLAAIFLLTNIGLMEKGRLAEIEALYLSLFGVALLLWLRAWLQEVAAPSVPRAHFPWLTWTLPYLFLGLGLLTKGPLHLVFFYATVLGVLVATGRWRESLNWAHLAGLVLMLGIFAAWAVPYFRAMHGGEVAGKWYAQFAGRAEVGENFSLGSWLLNVPRALVNFLPWVVLLPAAWRGRLGTASKASAANVREEDGDLRTPLVRSVVPPPGAPGDLPMATLESAVARGLRWSLALCFLAICLAPGGIPRYTLPLLVPASILLALTFNRRSYLAATGLIAAGDRHPPQAERSPEQPEENGRPVPVPSPRPESALPLVWERTLAGCLWLAVLTAPVAAVFGGNGTSRWLVGLAVMTVGAYLLRRVPQLRRFAEDSGSSPARTVPLVLPLALASGVAMALLTANYAVGVVHRLRRNESVRPIGAEIRRTVPAGQRVAVLQPGFVPFLFYVDHPLYLPSAEAVDPSARYLLVRQSDLATADPALHERGFAPRILLRLKDKRIPGEQRGTWLLLGLDRPGEPGL